MRPASKNLRCEHLLSLVPSSVRRANLGGVLALTKVDWNNNTLHKTLPVTLDYSQKFANVVKQNPEIVNDVYDYRLFM